MPSNFISPLSAPKRPLLTTRAPYLLLLSLLFTSSLSSGAQAQNKRVQMKDKPILKAVTSAETYPYNFQKDGQVQGFAFDVTKTLVERAGYQLQVDIVPWPRALQLAQNDSGTMIFSVARTAIRERVYHWIGPITTSEVWLYKLASRTDIQIAELRDVSPYLIGDIAGNSTLSLLKSLGYKIDTAPSNISNCNKFKIGRVDLIPFDPNGVDAFLQTCGIAPQQVVKVLHLPRDTALYIGLSKNTSLDIVNQLQREFAAMTKDQTLQKIVLRWKQTQTNDKK
jgi:polar amino acid transport system substrate-binding protein